MENIREFFKRNCFICYKKEEVKEEEVRQPLNFKTIDGNVVHIHSPYCKKPSCVLIQWKT